MNVAYVDASALVAIAFGEPSAAVLVSDLREFDALYSSPVLEAELRAGLQREGVAHEADLLGWIGWVLPERPLTREIGHVQSVAELAGLPLWHLACALYLAGDPAELSFITVDVRQREAADALGFHV